MSSDKRKKDRHKKKPMQIRVHALIRQQLEALAERNATTLTAEAERAIRELLQREGLWPPKPAQSGDQAGKSEEGKPS